MARSETGFIDFCLVLEKYQKQMLIKPPNCGKTYKRHKNELQLLFKNSLKTFTSKPPHKIAIFLRKKRFLTVQQIDKNT